MEQAATQTPWADFKKWWTNREENNEDESGLDYYPSHPLISPAMITGNTVITVLDIPSMKYLYLSPNFFDFFGLEKEQVLKKGVEFSFSQVHPHDKVGITTFSEVLTAYFKALPNSLRGSYRTYWDYRLLKNKSREYHRFLQQDSVLAHDESGNILQLLVVGVKIENVIPDTSQHLRLTNGIENLFYKYDHATKAVAQLQLPTEREMEIVKLIAKSATLKQIAEKLNISFNTVKSHSTNIMQKLQVKDSLEMVNLLRVWGFI